MDHITDRIMDRIMVVGPAAGRSDRRSDRPGGEGDWHFAAGRYYARRAVEKGPIQGSRCHGQ